MLHWAYSFTYLSSAGHSSLDETNVDTGVTKRDFAKVNPHQDRKRLVRDIINQDVTDGSHTLQRCRQPETPEENIYSVENALASF